MGDWLTRKKVNGTVPWPVWRRQRCFFGDRISYWRGHSRLGFPLIAVPQSLRWMWSLLEVAVLVEVDEGNILENSFCSRTSPVVQDRSGSCCTSHGHPKMIPAVELSYWKTQSEQHSPLVVENELDMLRWHVPQHHNICRDPVWAYSATQRM